MVKIIQGDCLEKLREMPSESVNCCVTSPPYWGLRDYGVAGQIGKEKTVEDWVVRLVDVFEEVRRVLRHDGTAWVNLGDCYAAGKMSNVEAGGGGRVGCGSSFRRDRIARQDEPHRAVYGLKPKDLVGQPWRLAFALQQAGWYLRQDIIWHKPNPMPESIKDRCTKAHEYIFLLSKSERYYFDQESILEPVSENTHARLAQNVEAQVGSERANGGVRADRPMKAVARKPCAWHQVSVSHDPGAPEYEPRRNVGVGANARPRKAAPNGVGTKSSDDPRVVDADVSARFGRGAGWRNKNNASFDAAMAIMPMMRNKRSVWTVPTKGYKGAHFATFPPALIRPCILAGCPMGGVVLDPFGGSGTTGEVAEEEGRNSILIELNPKYVELGRERTRQAGLFCVKRCGCSNDERIEA